MLMDFDREVTAAASQPFWLRWRDEDDGSWSQAADLSAPLGTATAVCLGGTR